MNTRSLAHMHTHQLHPPHFLRIKHSLSATSDWLDTPPTPGGNYLQVLFSAGYWQPSMNRVVQLNMHYICISLNKRRKLKLLDRVIRKIKSETLLLRMGAERLIKLVSFFTEVRGF